MSDELIGIEEMMAADGFVDFYKVLSVTRTATSEEILENANLLYQEAQTNRDHRVPARRRESQLLLEVLPQARTILTDKARRKRYDAYCNAVEMQLPRMPYGDFFSDLMREKEAIAARSDILTVRDLSRLRNSTPETVASNNGGAPKAATLTEVVVEPERVSAPVMAAPAPKEAVAATVTPDEPAPTTSPSGTHFFPVQSLVGGAIVLAGMLASLLAYAAIPIAIAAPIALLSAGVTAFVFSMTAEPLDA